MIAWGLRIEKGFDQQLSSLSLFCRRFHWPSLCNISIAFHDLWRRRDFLSRDSFRSWEFWSTFCELWESSALKSIPEKKTWQLQRWLCLLVKKSRKTSVTKRGKKKSIMTWGDSKMFTFIPCLLHVFFLDCHDVFFTNFLYLLPLGAWKVVINESLVCPFIRDSHSLSPSCLSFLLLILAGGIFLTLLDKKSQREEDVSHLIAFPHFLSWVSVYL